MTQSDRMLRISATRRTGARDPRPPASAPLRETVYRPRHPLDLHATVVFQRRGAHDPALVVDGAVIWRASRTPQGVATLALRASRDGVRAAAW
ncbi:MAG: DNA-3-methyladenine glycosylase 2 family protein, partial [Microbacterium sp.]